jgi:pimeloyl-ACP methyl ester carboxylesterase
MTKQPTITRINLEDPRTKAALDTERRLFAHYDLDYKSHFVEMSQPDLRLRVLEVGSGEPLLMVPGGTGDAMFFAAIMAELKGWRMIAINRPGGGLSDGVDHRQVNVRQLAVDTVRTVADEFGLDRVPIVCNSMGGLWSFWYALEYPERVSKMVQMGCPALILNTSAPFFMRLLSVPGINRFIASSMQPKSIETALEGLRFQGSSQEDINRMPPIAAEAVYHFFNLPTFLDSWKSLVAAVATLTGAQHRYQLGAEQLKHVQQPVHFIWGPNDPFGDLAVARQATGVIPQATLHEMPVGHLPFLDKPEETGRVIRGFLEEAEQVGDSNGSSQSEPLVKIAT